MAVLPIRLWGDPCLRRIAEPVVVDDAVRQLAADMIDTMYDAPGRGLAAPQVGVNLRMFVMDAHWKDGDDREPWVVINPVLSDASDTVAPYVEGCLSIPDVPVDVLRPVEVTMNWQGLEGDMFAKRLKGFEATCAQHEFDHLQGVLIPDHLNADGRAEIAEALATLVQR